MYYEIVSDGEIYSCTTCTIDLAALRRAQQSHVAAREDAEPTVVPAHSTMDGEPDAQREYEMNLDAEYVRSVPLPGAVATRVLSSVVDEVPQDDGCYG